MSVRIITSNVSHLQTLCNKNELDRLKHECLKNVRTLSKARCKGNQITVAEGIMGAKVNCIPLFEGIE